MEQIIKPQSEDRFQILHRRTLPAGAVKIVLEWRTPEHFGDPIDPAADIGSKFEGADMAQNSGRIFPIQFNIGNVKTLDEAFAAHSEAAKVHCQMLDVQQNQMQAQMIAQREQAKREKTIQDAVNGIQLSR